MSKGYEDLSRRGLIKLNHDFDQEFDGALQQYLAENGDKYEDIRPAEAIIDRIDQVVDTVSNSGYRIKEVISKEGNNIVESIIDVIADTADISADEINATLADMIS